MAPTAHRTRTTFTARVAVTIDIDASPETVWTLLADASEQARWNSTLESIEGSIEDGGKVTLVASVAPDRTFSLDVSEVVPNTSMTWSDGFAPMFRGVRTFSLSQVDGKTRFEMVETMSGLMLPMIIGSLPDFVPVFETYAQDLKQAAEAA